MGTCKILFFNEKSISDPLGIYCRSALLPVPFQKKINSTSGPSDHKERQEKKPLKIPLHKPAAGIRTSLAISRKIAVLDAAIDYSIRFNTTPLSGTKHQFCVDSSNEIRLKSSASAAINAAILITGISHRTKIEILRKSVRKPADRNRQNSISAQSPSQYPSPWQRKKKKNSVIV